MKPRHRYIALLLGASITTALADSYKISLDFNAGNTDGTGTGATTSGIRGAMPGQTSGDVWNNIPVGNAWVGFHPTNPGLANGGTSGGVVGQTKVLNRITGVASPISLAVSASPGSGQRSNNQTPTTNTFIAQDAITLMRDYLFMNGGGNTMTLTLSGCVPTEAYTLYLYGAGDNTNQGGAWAVSPATGATFLAGDNTTAAENVNPNLTLGQDYIVVTFDGSSPTRAFTISGTSTRAINGFQLDVIDAPTFANLAITGGASQVVGAPFTITVTAQDINSQPVADSTTPVTLSSSVPGSLLEFDWNEDGIYGDNSGTLVAGVKTVQVRTKKAQVGTGIIATAGSATSLPLFTFDAAAGPYTQLQILAPGETAAPGTATGKTGSPSIRVLEQDFQVTVNAVDSFWNLANPTADPEIAITSTDSLANLPFPSTISSQGSLFTLFFGSTGTHTVTATDTGSTGFSASTPALTVYGSPLTWVGGNSANAWDTATENWSGVSTIYSDPSQVTFDSNGSTTPAVSIVGTVSPSLVTVNSTTNYTFEGAGSIAGAFGGFNKSGSGSLTVSTANTYTGKTTVSGGVLILNNANALPSASPLALTGGILGLQSNDFTRSIGTGANQVTLTSGSGFAAFGANRAVNFGGALAPFTWDVDLAAGGTLVLNTTSATHTLEIQNPIILSSGTNFFQVNDGGAAVDAILSGAISTPLGGSGLSKTGNGTLVLINTGNTFNQSFIDFGTIMLGAANVIPDSANFTVKRGGASGAQSVLDLNGFSDTLNTLTLGDNGSGNSGTPSVINSDVSTPAKAAAVLTLNGGLNYNAGTTVGNLYSQATISANLSTGTGNRTLVVGNGSAAEDLVISGDLTGESIEKTGLGTLRIVKPLNTGNTIVTTGTLIVGAANPNNDASAITIGAAGVLNLDFAGTDAVNALTVNGAVQPNGVYGAAQHPGFITGTGTLTVGTPPADPFLAWAGNNPAILFDGDENNDGIENGVAWLLGAVSPTSSVTPPTVTQNGSGLVITFNMLNAASRGTSTVQIEHSSDLGIVDDWTAVTVPETSGGPTSGVTFVVTGGSPSNGVVATISNSESSTGRLFGRVKGIK